MRWFRRGEGGSSLDLLVACLGNPGREYADTRHNVGFMAGDELARRHGASFRAKVSGELAEFRLDGSRVAVLKPLTFMNESGRAVGAAMRFFKVSPDALLVVHDEVDLEPGRLQVRLGGGLAGHNGLRSVAQHVKTSDFLRVRVGVGRPERGDPRPVADFVLSPCPPELDVDALVGRAAAAAEVVAREGFEAAQQRFNERA